MLVAGALLDWDFTILILDLKVAYIPPTRYKGLGPHFLLLLMIISF